MEFYNMASDLVAMFFLGFFGTGHCVGMCGPLTIAFPGRVGRLSAHLFYHLGRILTYGAVGGLIGFIGNGGMLIETAKVQSLFSLFAAVFLLWFALIRLDILKEPRFFSAFSPHRIPGVDAVLGAASRRRTLSMLPLGLAMGLLPCGLSYAAFSRALPVGGALPGMMLLLAFGLGTLPGLLLVGTAASRLLIRYRRLSDVVAAVVMTAMAIDLFADVVVVQT